MSLRTALASYSRWTDRARAAYLRTLPRSVVARIDPPLRATMMHTRRVAATPFYLRQQHSEWAGPCGDATARVAVWGKPGSPSWLRDLFFDGAPSGEWREPAPVWDVLRNFDRVAPDADVVLAETTPLLAGAFARRGCLIVSDRMRLGAPVPALMASLARPAKSVQSDLNHAGATGYRTEIWSYTRARSERVYRDYVAAYAAARFAGRVRLGTFASVDRLFAAGFAVAACRPGSTDPDAVMVVVPRGRTLWWVVMGTRNGDPALVRDGAFAALYAAVIRLAAERGMDAIDAGPAASSLADGVTAYKWKWGFRPIVATAQTLEYAIKLRRPTSAAARRLEERRVLVRDGARFFVLGGDGRAPV